MHQLDDKPKGKTAYKAVPPKPAACKAVLLAAALALSVLAADARACPNCRENLPNGKQAGGAESGPMVAQGYAWSIYLMIAVPFVLAGTMGVTAFVLVKKQAAKGAAITARKV